MRKRQYPSLGSVSHGTMRTEDLLSAFEDYCRDYGGRQGKKLAREYDRMPESELDGEEAQYLLEEMFDLLNEICPPYVHFGAHEGNGSDYGFWPSIDGLEEAVRCGEMVKVNDLSEIPADYRGEVMLVNDHGNVTFGYAHRPNQHGNFKTVWDCV